MKKVTTALALTLLFLPAFALAERAPSKKPRPDLSGTWTLNEAMSETAQEKMREMMSQRRGERGGGGFGGPPSGTGRGGAPAGGWGGGSGGGGGFGGPRGGRGTDRGGPMASLDEGVDVIEISQSDDQLSIAYSDGRLRILFTDGRKDERTGPMGDVVTTAKWNKEGQLVIKSKTRRGKTIKIYRLDEDGKRLLVDIAIDSPRGEITIHRTYDPTPASAESASLR